MAGVKIAELVGDGAPKGASSKFIQEQNVLKEEILKAAREEVAKKQSAESRASGNQEEQGEETKRFRWDWNAFMQKLLVALAVAVVTYWIFGRKR